MLRKNGLHPIVMAEAVRDLLVNGRGKHRNIFIADPADCAKTFILEPLQKYSSLFPTQLTTNILGWTLRMQKLYS